jgi:acetolactate synthase-1/2/3 large subunit
MILMNDNGYGVIRNIQDHEYGGRRFGDIKAPDFEALCRSFEIEYRSVQSVAAFNDGLTWARKLDGPAVLDVDMATIGTFTQTWAGPPARKT